MNRAALIAAFLLASTIARVALANPAYTQGYVHLRAGPSADYPLVITLPPSTLLEVNGCVDDFSWCDVAWGENRGWVYGSFLYYDYQSRRVPILDYGAALGIGIVAFSIGDYWGRYYPGRPWYGRESYWAHRPPPPRRPGGGHWPGGSRPPGGGQPPGGGGRPPMGGGRPPGGGHAPGGGVRPPGGQKPGGGARPPGSGNSPGGNAGRPHRPAPGPGRPSQGGGGQRPGRDAGQKPGPG